MGATASTVDDGLVAGVAEAPAEAAGLGLGVVEAPAEAAAPGLGVGETIAAAGGRSFINSRRSPLGVLLLWA